MELFIPVTAEIIGSRQDVTLGVKAIYYSTLRGGVKGLLARNFSVPRTCHAYVQMERTMMLCILLSPWNMPYHILFSLGAGGGKRRKGTGTHTATKMIESK